MSLSYRLIDDLDDYRAAEDLQDAVWGGGDRDIVPVHMLLSAQKAGGLLLGAFDGPTLVGLVFGILGRTESGRLRHCSHLLAVLPAYRGRRVGETLKLRQREFVHAQGIDLITWTYDPLESRNAGLNIHALGAVCGTFLRDLYGSMPDALNAGLPSDRFEVGWLINSRHVIDRLAHGSPRHYADEALLLNPAAPTDEDGPAERIMTPHGPLVLIRIPAEFQDLKRLHPERAAAWRIQTRALFEDAFAAGYTVVDFVREGDRCAYLLEYGWRPE